MEKIKDVYNCHKLEGNDPLVIWHNQVIEKHPDELTVADIARCIRQNIFVESAYEVLLSYLLHNPYSGDLYEGELMEKASMVDNEIIFKHKKSVKEIVENAKKFIDTHEWTSGEEKMEYIEAVEKLAVVVG